MERLTTLTVKETTGNRLRTIAFELAGNAKSRYTVDMALAHVLDVYQASENGGEE